nr:DegT/DnrJ/EryC1/StrS family aminotransferase [Bacteroidales bacterium]
TNRAQFFRGEINKYGWVDVGSSFLPSEINAAFLWAQLENIEKIQKRRIEIWNEYSYKIVDIRYKMPYIPVHATNNAHMFYMVCENEEERTQFIAEMKKQGVNPVFHYQSLHASDFYKDKHDGRALPNADRYTDCLVRLPLFYELGMVDIREIIALI